VARLPFIAGKAPGAGVRLAALAVFLAACLAAGAALVICPKCGYENAEAGKPCVHCGAALPKPPPPPETAGAAGKRPGAVRPGLPPVEAGAVEEEIALGRQHLAEGSPELARLLFRNAAALALLSDPASLETGGDAILELLRACEPSGMSVPVPCPDCGGTGKRAMQRAGADGRASLLDGLGRTCEKCEGSGTVMAFGSIAERKYARGRAEREYAVLQRGRRMEPAGRAWAPAGTAARLTVEQSAMLRRATSAPCPECMGFGRTDCGACRGGGRVKCPERGCEDGMIEVKTRSSWSKTPLTRREKCRTCRGLGLVRCSRCDGKGSFVCEKCNGSGERGTCASCGGEGCGPCRRCGGTGRHRDAECAACGGRGVALCEACRGDGRQK